MSAAIFMIPYYAVRNYQFQNFIKGPSAFFSPEEQNRRIEARRGEEGFNLIRDRGNILSLECTDIIIGGNFRFLKVAASLLLCCGEC